MSTNTTNDTDMNCCPYEVIIIDSDDLESNECKTVVTNHQQPDDSSIADLISDGDVDSDGYQCPDSSEIRETICNTETFDNNYLTVVWIDK